MGTITAETTTCPHCATILDEDNEARDSNGNDVCTDCYFDGTAYVECLDFQLDQ